MKDFGLIRSLGIITIGKFAVIVASVRTERVPLYWVFSKRPYINIKYKIIITESVRLYIPCRRRYRPLSAELPPDCNINVIV